MKETEGLVKIKKYTEDGKPVCGDPVNGPRYERMSWNEMHQMFFCNHQKMKIPGPSCPVWHGESKSEWQPIETAPKDGTDIILGRGDMCAIGGYDYG